MTILYIDNEICDTFEQLKGFFRQEQMCDNAVYSDLLDISRHGEISAWLMENGREELAMKVDAIDSKVGDSEYIGLLAKVMTGTTDVSFSKPAIEDILAWTDLKIDKNQEDNYAKVTVSFKVLKAVNETYEVRISSDWGDTFRTINPSNFKDLSTIHENVVLMRRPDRELSDVKLFYDGNELVKTIDIPKAVYKTSHKPSKKTFTVGDVSFDMIFVEGGTFDMNADNNGTRKVYLDDFYIGEFVVTQKLWNAIYKERNSFGCDYSNCGGGPNYPVIIDYADAQDFIKKLNVVSMENGSFRLPTEAEWEYAARGGRFSQNYIYSGGNKIREVAWYGGATGNSGGKIHEVGQKKPNELELYDMSGNVNEWCEDEYGLLCPSSEIDNNPCYKKDNSNSNYHCSRGGGYWLDELDCRIFERHKSYYYDMVGLRLVYV